MLAARHWIAHGAASVEESAEAIHAMQGLARAQLGAGESAARSTPQADAAAVQLANGAVQLARLRAGPAAAVRRLELPVEDFATALLERALRRCEAALLDEVFADDALSTWLQGAREAAKAGGSHVDLKTLCDELVAQANRPEPSPWLRATLAARTADGSPDRQALGDCAKAVIEKRNWLQHVSSKLTLAAKAEGTADAERLLALLAQSGAAEDVARECAEPLGAVAQSQCTHVSLGVRNSDAAGRAPESMRAASTRDGLFTGRDGDLAVLSEALLGTAVTRIILHGATTPVLPQPCRGRRCHSRSAMALTPACPRAPIRLLVLGYSVGVRRLFTNFLISNRVPHGFTQDPSTDLLLCPQAPPAWASPSCCGTC